ncbi:MAG TPA: metallophosphoesterase [bacterium]|nr:metallophosphoesterase [bacterium]
MRIAALGDLHVRDTLPQPLRDLFAEVSGRAEVLVLCGDLTDRGLPDEAEALAEALAVCRIPIISVLGNHDYESGQQGALHSILARSGVSVLDGESHEVHGVGFAGVKGFAGGFDDQVLQPWGEEIVKQFVHEAVNESLRLETALTRLRSETGSLRAVALMHYAPIRQTVEGEPLELVPFLGSSRLVDPIDRSGAVAVFHAHAHHGSYAGTTPKGIPVYNVSLPVLRRLTPERPFALIEV